MAKTLSEMIEQYRNPEGDTFTPEKFPHSFRVDYATKCKIEFIARHFGIKKSPFLAELVSAAITEMFEEIEGDIDQDELAHFYQDLGEVQYQEAVEQDAYERANR